MSPFSKARSTRRESPYARRAPTEALPGARLQPSLVRSASWTSLASDMASSVMSLLPWGSSTTLPRKRAAEDDKGGNPKPKRVRRKSPVRVEDNGAGVAPSTASDSKKRGLESIQEAAELGQSRAVPRGQHNAGTKRLPLRREHSVASTVLSQDEPFDRPPTSPLTREFSIPRMSRTTSLSHPHVRATLTPQRGTFGPNPVRSKRDPSLPPLLGRVTPTLASRPPSLGNFPKSQTGETSFIRLGSGLRDEEASRPSRDYTKLVLDPQFGITTRNTFDKPVVPSFHNERALNSIETLRTPLLSSRIMPSAGSNVDQFSASVNPPPRIPKVKVPLPGPRPESKAPLGFGGKSGYKKPLLNAKAARMIQPYSGSGGLRKLLAKRQQEEEAVPKGKAGEPSPMEVNVPTGKARKDDAEQSGKENERMQEDRPSSTPSRVTPTAIASRAALTSGRTPGSTPLRVPRTTLRTHKSTPSRPISTRGTFSAKYEEEEEDDDLPAESEIAKAAASIPVLSVPTGFSFKEPMKIDSPKPISASSSMEDIGMLDGTASTSQEAVPLAKPQGHKIDKAIETESPPTFAQLKWGIPTTATTSEPIAAPKPAFAWGAPPVLSEKAAVPSTSSPFSEAASKPAFSFAPTAKSDAPAPSSSAFSFGAPKTDSIAPVLPPSKPATALPFSFGAPKPATNESTTKAATAAPFSFSAPSSTTPAFTGFSFGKPAASADERDKMVPEPATPRKPVEQDSPSKDPANPFYVSGGNDVPPATSLFGAQSPFATVADKAKTLPFGGIAKPTTPPTLTAAPAATTTAIPNFFGSLAAPAMIPPTATDSQKSTFSFGPPPTVAAKNPLPFSLASTTPTTSPSSSTAPTAPKFTFGALTNNDMNKPVDAPKPFFGTGDAAPTPMFGAEPTKPMFSIEVPKPLFGTTEAAKLPFAAPEAPKSPFAAQEAPKSPFFAAAPTEAPKSPFTLGGTLANPETPRSPFHMPSTLPAPASSPFGTPSKPQSAPFTFSTPSASNGTAFSFDAPKSPFSAPGTPVGGVENTLFGGSQHGTPEPERRPSFSFTAPLPKAGGVTEISNPFAPKPAAASGGMFTFGAAPAAPAAAPAASTPFSFGQPSSTTNSAASSPFLFGQPPQASTTPSATPFTFGAPTTSTKGPTIPSFIGRPPPSGMDVSPVREPTKPATASAGGPFNFSFGAPAATTASNPFGNPTSSFNQPAQPSSPFYATSNLPPVTASAAPQSLLFGGQPTGTMNGFGAQPAATTNGFGAPAASPFGNGSAPNSPFAAAPLPLPSSAYATPSPTFGAALPSFNAGGTPNGFPAPPQGAVPSITRNDGRPVSGLRRGSKKDPATRAESLRRGREYQYGS